MRRLHSLVNAYVPGAPWTPDCKSVIRGFESHLGLAKTALALAPGPILRAACAARTRMVSDVQDAPQDAL